MAKFEKKRGKSTPEISTASLPDIIFILLFFFMVVTVMRETTLKVWNRLPQATELTKLERKSLVSYIYIGAPIPKYQPQLGTASRIQLNDQFATVKDIASFVEMRRTKIDEQRPGTDDRRTGRTWRDNRAQFHRRKSDGERFV